MSDTSDVLQPIASRDELRRNLWEACEIEQQLMIQYLFAAFTLKKHPDDTCTPAQLEHVRRWGSQVYMVARQEMEHLALANGILTAIGEDPFFARENIGDAPIQSPYLRGEQRVEHHSPRLLRAALLSGDAPPETPLPCDIPFLFERFNLDSVGRFVCAESPSYDQLLKEGERIADWCFSPCRPRNDAAARPARSHLPPDQPFHPGSIQMLYDRIKAALTPDLFVGNPAQQVFVPVEYQINVTAVTSVQTAQLAIELIVEEGEGIDAPPGFQTHYSRFYDVRDALLALQEANPGFDPALPVMTNPTREQITDPYTGQVFELFNYAYTSLLFVLTSLYRNFDANESSYPFLSNALQAMAFGPFMTMVLRPVAEVLAHLQVGDGSGRTAGPDFHLTPEDEALLVPRGLASAGNQEVGDVVPGLAPRIASPLDDIQFHLDRLEQIVARLDALSADGGRLRGALLRDDLDEWARRQLAFVHENARAMANNMRRIYQVGELPQFIVSGG